MGGKERKNVEILITSIGEAVGEAVGNPTVWLTYQFAPEWFRDASEQARIQSDHNARRREIIFAVCCAESYLVEWVLKEVLKDDYSKFGRYFPPPVRPSDKRPAEKKWQEVPKQLQKDGLIPKSPEWDSGDGQRIWCEWLTLLAYRHGLVHASASRPETDPQPRLERPLPSKHELDRLPAGWATKTVTKLIAHLHEAVGTPVPKWLA